MATVTCKDCGNEYEAGAPHMAFCPAKTCSLCGTTGSEVLEPVIYSELDENEDPYRLCSECEDESEDDPDDE